MNPASWFARDGRIVTKEVVGASSQLRQEAPKANALQSRVGEIITWCKLHRKPIRIIIYKPRQKGCSTITVAALYVLARSIGITGLIAGGLAVQGSNLWKILRHYVETDQFDWGNTAQIDDEKMTCSNGTIITRLTAGSTGASRSGTNHIVILTELAYWPTTGVKSASVALNAILGTVPDGEDGTMVVIESTANGPVGEFPDTFKKAASFEDVKAGNLSENWNGYISLFVPWQDFPECWVKLTQAERDGLREKILRAGDVKAVKVWDKFGLAPEQVAWFHKILQAPECNGDPTRRDREYPSEPADGFSASLPSRFNTEALDALDKDCVNHADKLLYGNLEMPMGSLRPTFVPCEKRQATVCMIEKPIVGCSYVGWTDNCKGESHVVGDDTDCNSAGINRKGYYDHGTGIWHPPEPVCVLTAGNRWDMPEFAKVVKLMAIYYGRCMVVPESNRGEYLIDCLRDADSFGGAVMVYERPKPIEEVNQQKPSGRYGFETNKKTRPYIISTLAGAIKDYAQEGAGLRCRIPHILAECRTFIRHEDGWEGAMIAKSVHDDFVVGFAIGLTCIESATMYVAPSVKKVIPDDLRRHYAPQSRRGVW